MECKVCGKQLDDNALVCDGCNTPVAAKTPPERPLKSRNGFAVAALVFGLIGIPAFFLVIFNLLAILFGALSIRSEKENNAKAGIILGMVGCVIAILLYAVLLSGTNLHGVADFIYYNVFHA